MRFYNKRGTAEQWIKEGKQAVKMMRLSCHRFRSNEVRLWLSVIAYNLGNLWRRLVLPNRLGNWSLTSLQQRLVKTGGPVGQARAILLAAVGREPSDAAALWKHGAADRCAALADRIGAAGNQTRRRRGDGEVYEKSLEVKHFRVLGGGGAGPFPGPPEAVGMERMKKRPQRR